MKTNVVVIPCMMLLAACGGDGGTTPTPVDPTLIGPTGGEVRSADGQASLMIPANALRSPTRVTIAPVTTLPLDARISGAGYQVEPAGTTFATPATLTLRFSESAIPGGALATDIAVASVDQAGLTPVAGSSTPAAGSVTTPISAAGTFVPLWHPSTTCAAAPSRQFDFWLGRWTFAASGQPNGDQTVAAVGNGCGLREAFVQGTYRGSSVSLFNVAQQRWHQTYVDSDRARRLLSGTFTGGAMVLNETATVRYVWRTTSPTVVRFTEERTTDGGTTWRETFVSTYTRIP